MGDANRPANAPVTAFNERRTAQAAAFLLHKAGGELPVIKLLKLMYLAERLSLQRYGEPLTGDRLVSMDHGPVLSRTYDQIQGAVQDAAAWEEWVSDREDHIVALRERDKLRDPQRDLPALSDSDLDVLGEVWEQFGRYGKWELVRYTHKHCPEWQDPHGSSMPIRYATLLEAVGYTPEQALTLIERMREQRQLDTAFE